MADIQMTQINGGVHHYRALIDVEPANLEPTIDLFDFIGLDLKNDVTTQRMIESITSDTFLEEEIFAIFEAKTTSVKACAFIADSLEKVFNFAGILVALTIKLRIQTEALLPQLGAIEMKLEFRHTAGR